ncbi:hypothetical protein TVAG_268210 [Trichomonas vaginalis G3]|uniref:Uncharacterized protein n=1 Tax=Trichomonas vaginalis (strain ATCC PRA-98 / G3) TaxID=412133 RepID=A2DLH0_TRIV3|nr:protein ubiquitination [Trichomonas vaginalis G3]EAY18788.1 hypothetical protein TVAG_268210 [Trichomonas vaginalis G3]KAI5539276.1 protein ubiquitination [Trichomonas vaginalis G3]|eukprot:XP_001579774.1 hypothetical protein [Trichomonas vaginalis G3]
MKNTSYQLHANNIDQYLADKSFYTRFNKDEACKIMDYMRVNIDQAVKLLEQAKGKLKPMEVFELIHHWHINFGWDANKAAKISLLLSDLLQCKFINEYICYFMKKIMEFYEDSIKEAKRVRNKNKKITKELEDVNTKVAALSKKSAIDASQIEAYSQIQEAHITMILDLQSEVETMKSKEQNMKSILENKDMELNSLKRYFNSSVDLFALDKSSSDENTQETNMEDQRITLNELKRAMENPPQNDSLLKGGKPELTKSSSQVSFHPAKPSIPRPSRDDSFDQAAKSKLTNEIMSLNAEVVKLTTELVSCKQIIDEQKKIIEDLNKKLQPT